jgi:hypothetical protein
MSKPGAHIQDAQDTFEAFAKAARAEARTLTTRAEIYEDCAMRLQDAIEKERRKAVESN